MKISVNTIICLQLLYCLVFVSVVDVFGSSLSWYGTVSNFTTMGYNRDQLFSLRNNFTNDSKGYVSILKENGIFKFNGPRGSRAGVQHKNKVHKISSVLSNKTKDITQSDIPSQPNVFFSEGN